MGTGYMAGGRVSKLAPRAEVTKDNSGEVLLL